MSRRRARGDVLMCVDKDGLISRGGKPSSSDTEAARHGAHLVRHEFPSKGYQSAYQATHARLARRVRSSLPFPSFRTPPPLIDTSRPIAVKSFERRISPLVALGILSINTRKGIQYVHMHPTFRHGLRNALANGYVRFTPCSEREGARC